MSAERRIGIPPLDAVLAPIPDGASVLLANDPGIESEAFLFQVAAHHLTEGQTVVYAVTSRGVENVRRAFTEHGYDLREFSDRLVFVDAHSALTGVASTAHYTVADPTDMESFLNVVSLTAEDHPKAVLILEQASAMADHVGVEAFVQANQLLHDSLEGFGLSVVSFTKWPYGESYQEIADQFAATVELRAVEDRVRFGHYFAAVRADWMDAVDDQPRLYKVLKPGGVFVYIPKIVITGPHNAGKSTFIHTVSDSAVSVDRLGTTVALDHGRVKLEGLAADLFGTPGQVRFDPLLRTIASQALGVIVMVDATKPDSFQRAREMMDGVWRAGLPAIVAANKQDESGAMPPEEVARLIAGDLDVKVVGCVAHHRDSSRQVLRGLLNQVLSSGELIV